MVKRIELNSQDDWTTIKSMISDFAGFRPTIVFRDQSYGEAILEDLSHCVSSVFIQVDDLRFPSP